MASHATSLADRLERRITKSAGPYDNLIATDAGGNPVQLPDPRVQEMQDPRLIPGAAGYVEPVQGFTPLGRWVSKKLMPVPSEAVVRGTVGTAFNEARPAGIQAAFNAADAAARASGMSQRGSDDIAGWADNFLRPKLHSLLPPAQKDELRARLFGASGAGGLRAGVLANLARRTVHEGAVRQGRLGRAVDIGALSLLLGGAFGAYRAWPKIKAVRESRKKDGPEVDKAPAQVTDGASEPETKTAQVEQALPQRRYESLAPAAPKGTGPWQSEWAAGPGTLPMYLAAGTVPFMLAAAGADKLTNWYRQRELKKQKEQAVREFQAVLSGTPMLGTATEKVAGLVDGLDAIAESYAEDPELYKQALSWAEAWQAIPGGLYTIGGASFLAGGALGRKLALRSDPNLKRMRALEIALKRRRLQSPVRLEAVQAAEGQDPAAPEYRGGRLDPHSAFRVPIYLPPTGERLPSRSARTTESALDLTKLSAYALEKLATVSMAMAPGGALSQPAPVNQESTLAKARGLWNDVGGVDGLRDTVKDFKDTWTRIKPALDGVGRMVDFGREAKGWLGSVGAGFKNMAGAALGSMGSTPGGATGGWFSGARSPFSPTTGT